MAQPVKARRSKGSRPVALMSHEERGQALRQALRRIAELEEECLRDPQYLSLRRELDALRQQFFTFQQGADRRARYQADAVARLERTEAAHRHDADCARAELTAVRAALADAPLSLFRASEETLRALRDAAEQEVGTLVDELNFAGQQMAGEISSLRGQLAEALDSAEHDEARRRERIEILEACFFTPARLARMNGTPPPAENLPQVFYWTPIGDPGKAVSYHISRAADQHATA